MSVPGSKSIQNLVNRLNNRYGEENIKWVPESNPQLDSIGWKLKPIPRVLVFRINPRWATAWESIQPRI